MKRIKMMAVAKGLVIVMSFLIAVLMGLIIYGFYQKSQNPNYKMFRSDDTPVAQADAMPGAGAEPGFVSGSPSAPAARAQSTAGEASEFGDIDLALAKTARVVSARTRHDRLTLVIARDGETADLVVIIDLQSGKVLGRVKTTP